MPDEMTRRERVLAAVAGERPDRVPVAFWRHFGVAADPARLAEATLGFFVAEHDLDLVKVMPDLGHPGPLGGVRATDDWRRLAELETPDRWRDAHVEVVRSVLDGLPDDRPVIVTLFSPLTTAAHLAPSLDDVLEALSRWPSLVGGALSALADVLADVAEAVVDAGADGIFLGLQGCSTAHLPADVYREQVAPHEAAVAGRVAGAPLRVAHLHAERDLFVDEVASWPVNVLSWSDRSVGPPLVDVRDRTGLAVMGGWDEHGAIAGGTVEDVVAEGLEALAATGGRGHVLAPGCSILADLDPARAAAARRTPWAGSTGAPRDATC